MYYFSFVTEFCRKKPYHAMLLGIVVDEGQMRTSTIPIIHINNYDVHPFIVAWEFESLL